MVVSGIRDYLKAGIRKNLSLKDEPAPHQLVGEVTAHQGLRVAGLRGWSATLGLRTAQTPTGGCSRGSFAMRESVTMRRRVQDEGLRVVSCCHGGARVVILIILQSDSTPGGSHG